MERRDQDQEDRGRLCRNGNSKALAFSLHGKHLSAHLEHRLEAFTALDGVLLEALDGKVLDAVLDLLPTAAEGSDLSGLLEDCARGGAGGRGTVNDSFADGEEIVEGHVHAAHGDLFGGRVDVGCFVDLRDLLATEEGAKPFWCGLFASDETFGAELVLKSVVVLKDGINADSQCQWPGLHDAK